jgi:hypothetical protein
LLRRCIDGLTLQQPIPAILSLLSTFNLLAVTAEPNPFLIWPDTTIRRHVQIVEGLVMGVHKYAMIIDINILDILRINVSTIF